MIQRKQSIWFLMACIALIASYFVPVATKTVANTHLTITTHGVFQETMNQSSQILDYTIIAIGFLGIGVLLFLNIFVYKNRKLQKIIAFICLVFVVLCYFGLTLEFKSLPEGTESIQLSIGAFLPCFALFFTVLGIKGINSDMKLLKSADRLR